MNDEMNDDATADDPSPEFMAIRFDITIDGWREIGRGRFFDRGHAFRSLVLPPPGRVIEDNVLGEYYIVNLDESGHIALELNLRDLDVEREEKRREAEAMRVSKAWATGGGPDEVRKADLAREREAIEDERDALRDADVDDDDVPEDPADAGRLVDLTLAEVDAMRQALQTALGTAADDLAGAGWQPFASALAKLTRP